MCSKAWVSSSACEPNIQQAFWIYWRHLVFSSASKAQGFKPNAHACTSDVVSHLSIGLGKFPSILIESVLNVEDEEWVAHLGRVRRLPVELQRGGSSHHQASPLTHQLCAVRRAQQGELRGPPDKQTLCFNSDSIKQTAIKLKLKKAALWHLKVCSY